MNKLPAFRRSRSEVAQTPFDHVIAAFGAEVKGLESEASHAPDAKLSQAWSLAKEALAA